MNEGDGASPCVCLPPSSLSSRREIPCRNPRTQRTFRSERQPHSYEYRDGRLLGNCNGCACNQRLLRSMYLAFTLPRTSIVADYFEVLCCVCSPLACSNFPLGDCHNYQCRIARSIRRRSAMGVLSDLTGEGRPFSKAAFDGW